jgi:hypothetical protein
VCQTFITDGNYKSDINVLECDTVLNVKRIKLVLIFGIFLTIGLAQIELTIAEKKNFNIIRIGKYDDGGRVLGLQIDENNLAYVADMEQGLEIVNVTDKTNSTLVGKFDPNAGEPQNVFINGSYAFLANSFDGIRIINISNQKRPLNVSHYFEKEIVIIPFVHEVYTSASQDIYIDGSLGYIADGEFGVKVLNLTDLLNPTKIAEYNDEKGVARGIIVNDSYAYVADGDDGIEILDLSDLSNITRIGHYFDGGKAQDLHLVDSYLYVADSDNGLEILDVSDPTNPIEIGEFYDGGDSALSVFVVGDRAYVADNVDGLEVFDISDPTTPVKVGQFYATTGVVGLASDVVVDGDIIYVAFGTQGLEILTYGTPRTPIPILPLTFIAIMVLGFGVWIFKGGKSY